MGIYVSTETIVPREYKYAKINGNNPKLTFDYIPDAVIALALDDLTSINQFFLTKIEAEFKDEAAESKVNIRIQYSVYTADQVSLYNNVHEYKIAKRKENVLKTNSGRFYLPYVYNLKEKLLRFEVQVLNVSEVQDQIKGLTVYVETNNEKFFYFFWYFKWFLFGLSIYTALKFNKSYAEQLKQTRTLEQSHIIVLGILLIVYNFPISFYINETHPTILFILATSLVNISFYSYIIYLWLTTFEVR